MQCYTPLLRMYLSYTDKEKKTMKAEEIPQFQKVYSREYVMEKLIGNQNWLSWINERNKFNEEHGNRMRYQTIPCRHCYACSINYAAEWATRMACECITNGGKHNYFITLTYDEEHLPVYEHIDYVNEEGRTITFYNTGEDTWNTGTLQKDDSQKFIKRLRRYLEYHSELGKFKFFLCGEYGSQGRAHYHAILMDCRLDETQFYDAHIDANNNDVWKSKELDKLWGKGFVEVTDATWTDMAYVGRYVSKKWIKSFKPIDYYINGKDPEFITMSKGIGDEYFKLNMDKIYETDEMIAKTVKNNTSRIKPPKRCDQLLKAQNESKFDEIKAHRKKIKDMMEEILKTKTDMTDLEKLRLQEEKITTKALQLKREL